MKIIRWILGRIILIIDFVTRPKKDYKVRRRATKN